MKVKKKKTSDPNFTHQINADDTTSKVKTTKLSCLESSASPVRNNDVSINKRRKRFNKRNKYLSLALQSAPESERRDYLSTLSASSSTMKDSTKCEEMESEITSTVVSSECSKKVRKKSKNLNKADEKRQLEIVEELNSSNQRASKLELPLLPGNLNEDMRTKHKHRAELNVTKNDIISTSLTLKERMAQKLKSSHFRFINERLYSSAGQDAMKLFEENSSLFEEYHSGFQQQVSKWPVNPLHLIIKFIQARKSSLAVADFGCGDALLARSVPNEVHSFDLVAANEHVTACDMKRVPLQDESIDIAVFCLSLMGKNLIQYLCESHRVLKFQGILKIAEVESRFFDIDKFVKSVEKIGFELMAKDTSHKMFILFQFRKVKQLSKKAKKQKLVLKPCMYKKR